MANLGYVSSFNINGNELSLKDAALTEIVEEIIEAIGANNGDISDRINNLHERSFDALIKISSQNDSEISSIQDGMYKLQYVTVTGEGDEATETLNNSAILIQKGTNQYLYKDGQISSRTKTDNTWGNWITFEGGVTSVNGQTGAVTLNIPDDSNLVHKTGNETIDGNKTFNGSTIFTSNGTFADVKINAGQITGSAQMSLDGGPLPYAPNYTGFDWIKTVIGTGGLGSKPTVIYKTLQQALDERNNLVTSVNGQTGAVSITIPDVPVQSVNGQTGAVNITIPTKTSDLTNDSNFTTLAEVQTAIVDSAPGTLDTLNELAAALGDDPNFATTIASQIGAKYTKPSTGIPASDLADGVIPDVPVTSVNGQTGAVTIDHPVTSVNGQTGAITIDTGVTSFNGATGAITYTAPVTSVNGQTGAVTVDIPVTSVNGATGAVVTSLSSNYASATGVNDALQLASGDTYEQAFGKLEKAIVDNEEVVANSLQILNSGVSGIHSIIDNLQIPQNTSDLYNDSNYLASGDNISELNNDAGYLTLTDLSGAAAYGITSQDITNWNTAYTNNHTHSNKSVLDGISSSDITNWNNKLDSAPVTSVNGQTGAVTIDHPVTSVNGATGAVVTSLSNNYATATGVNSALELATGDTYEQAFGKLEKALIDNESVTSTAIDDLDDRLTELTNGVGDKNVIESISVNGTTQTITNKNVNISVPVTSVNGQTGAVTITETQLSKGTATGAGNAVTDITVSNHEITLVKGATYATQGDIDTSIASLVDSAPETLNTLNELAAALGDDPNFATTVATQIGQKYTKPSTGIPASDLADGVIPIVPVTSVNGATGAVVTSLSSNYATATGANSDLFLAANDTYETAFGKLEKAILDNESVTVDALVDTKLSIDSLHEDIDDIYNNIGSQLENIFTNAGFITDENGPVVPVTSVNGQTGAVTIDTGVTSFNGATGVISYTAPVISVNGMTGAVVIPEGGVTSFNGATGAISYTAPITSVNGATGVVVTSLSNNYASATGTNEALQLASGDTYEQAFGKLEKAIIDNEEVVANSLQNLNSTISQINIPTNVSDLNNDSGYLTLSDISSAPAYGISSSDITNWNTAYTNNHTHSNKSVLDSISSSDITNWNNKLDSAPVLSVNGQTGTVTITETQLSKGTATGAGNAVTDITVSNHQITLVKGATYATQTDIDNSIAALVDSAPGTLDTLNELAAALGDDPNFATTIAGQIGAKYTKPSTGIPSTDLANDVQTNLTLASTALQSFTETDPTVPSHVKNITSQDITNWNNKLSSAPVTSVNGQTGAVSLALGDTNVIETIKVNNTALTPVSKAVNITVPTKVSDLTNDLNLTSNVGTITGITMNGVSKGTSGVVDLGTVLTSHQDISGKVDKVTGMGLSSNDYTTTEKNKLAGINIGSLDSLTTAELNSIFS